jgi:hypothetical protein
MQVGGGAKVTSHSYISSSVWGSTCDGLNCVLHHTMLPELQVGDRLYFENMGAYTVAAAFSFNGFAPPVSRYFPDGSPVLDAGGLNTEAVAGDCNSSVN